MKVTRARIVEAARQCIGTPFRHQGRRCGPDGALDCAGVVRFAAVESGCIPAEYDFLHYPRFPKPTQIAAQLDRLMDHVLGGLSNALPGDVLLLADARWSHMAVLTEANGQPALVHTTRLDGRCMEHRLDEEWRRRVRAVYRFRGFL